ncbi:UDP-N-acetylglucosamine 2-epimerase, partial [Chloroflexota bacterium]
LQKEYGMPVICSLHPRTSNRIQRYSVDMESDRIQYHVPFGFFDFIALERNAFCVLSDSGTVQEECCIFLKANVTIRDVTERPETIECGSNILSGADPEMILQCTRVVHNHKSKWTIPNEYVVENVSDIVVNILLGYTHFPFTVGQ